MFSLLVPLLALDDSQAAIEQAFKNVRTGMKAPAVAAAVVRDGKVIWSKTDGKAGANDRFKIASLTKAFTATVILQMVEAKKVDLDGTIGTYLSDLPETWKPVTVRMLLNHTSGIPSYTDQATFIFQAKNKQTPMEIVGQTAKKPLDFEPGTKYAYNNTGYVILGILAEKIDGKPLAEILKTRIFNPLGMTKTELDTGDAKDVLTGYQKEDKPALALHMSQPYAAGSIVSTIDDMAKWAIAQGDPRLLPASRWAEMVQPGKLKSGEPVEYGYGWIPSKMNGIPTNSHGGGIFGFNSYISVVPSKRLGVVTLINSEADSSQALADALLIAAEPAMKAVAVAVPDPDPKVTVKVTTLLDGFVNGQIDRTMLDAGMNSRLNEQVTDQLQTILIGFGKRKALTLVKVDGSRREYLAEYEKQIVRVAASVDSEGKFNGFAIRPA